MSTCSPERGATVDVLYVLRRNAKAVKVSLEKDGLIHKQFRMTKPTDESISNTCVAIPVTEECLTKTGTWTSMVVARSQQSCPYSSSYLGNYKSQRAGFTSSSRLTTPVQQALLSALLKCSENELSASAKDDLIDRIQKLSAIACPKKLEVIGDDRTLVIPRRAFREDDDEFASLVAHASKPSKDWRCFWGEFSIAMGTSRVVRRGDIHPDSSIRESGHRLLWPYGGQPQDTGTRSRLQFEVVCSSFYRLHKSFSLATFFVNRARITWMDNNNRTRHFAVLRYDACHV